MTYIFKLLIIFVICFFSVSSQSEAASPILQLHKNGTGKGTITSTPAGLSCGGTCVLDFFYHPLPSGGPVTLTVVPETGSSVTKWSDPTCTGLTCTLPLTISRSVTVTIDKIPGSVSPPTTLSVLPTQLLFTAVQNSLPPPKQLLTITTPGTWSASQAPAWVKLSLITPRTLGVTVSPVGLPLGVIQGTIQLKGPTTPAVLVPVTLTVTSSSGGGTVPTLTIDKTVLTVVGRQFGQTGTNPAPQAVTVNGVTTFTATTTTPWIRVDRFNGFFNVQVLLVGMLPGTHTGTVTVTSLDAPTLTRVVTVNLTVTTAPTLSLTPARLSLQLLPTDLPQTQTVTVGNAGTGSLGSLSVTTTPPSTWLSLRSAVSTLDVTVTPTGLLPGTYTTTVAVQSTTAINSPFQLPVALQILQAPNGAISLLWDRNPDDPLAPTIGYRLYRSTTSQVYTEAAVMQVLHPLNRADDVLSGLPAGLTYFFTLTAFNVAGESLRSNELSLTVNLPISTP